jgi:hypothetical protein
MIKECVSLIHTKRVKYMQEKLHIEIHVVQIMKNPFKSVKLSSGILSSQDLLSFSSCACGTAFCEGDAPISILDLNK